MAIVLNNITSGYNLATINSNFQKIEDYVNDKLLARADTGVAGEAMMERALDMNGNKILNVFVDVNDPDSLLTLSVADSRYYNVSGDTLTGPMNANSQIINNLPTPVQPSQPATKAYADAIQADVDANESRSLRFPDTINVMSDVPSRSLSLQGYNNIGQPVPIFSYTDTADLALQLSSTFGASLVGYQASATASYRTVEKRLQDSVNVHDYFLASDTDYTSAFNKALATGKTVFVPEGVHYVTQIDLPAGATIIGTGPKSIISSKLATDAAGTDITTVLRGTNVSNIFLANFCVDGGSRPVQTVKKKVRTVRISGGDNIELRGIKLVNNTDWACSLEQCTNVVVLDYKCRTYEAWGSGDVISLTGGRDGLHFMDCQNVLASRIDVISGDDCVGITTEGVSVRNIDVSYVSGSSSIASIVIYNEEQDGGGNYYNVTSYNFKISHVSVKEGGVARNIVRVAANGTTSKVIGVDISNVSGTAYNSYGLWLVKVYGGEFTNINVASQLSHGIQIASCYNLHGNLNGQSQAGTITFAGINVTGCVSCFLTLESVESSGYGIQITNCSYSTFYLRGYNNGAATFASSTGGGARVATNSYCSFPSGMLYGDNTVSYYGINQAGNTNTTFGSEFKAYGFTNSSLGVASQLNTPVAYFHLKEDSGGVVTNATTFGGTIVRNSTGNYTVTLSSAVASTYYRIDIQALHNGQARLVRLASATSTTGFTFVILDPSSVATYADHIMVTVWGI